MGRHKRLEKRERGIIARMLAQGKGILGIARLLNRSPSSISDEVKRNRLWDGEKLVYEAIAAQEEYVSRKSQAGKREPLKNKWVYEYTRTHLKGGWSPEQISGRLHREHPLIGSRTIGIENHLSIYL